MRKVTLECVGQKHKYSLSIQNDGKILCDHISVFKQNDQIGLKLDSEFYE